MLVVLQKKFRDCPAFKELVNFDQGARLWLLRNTVQATDMARGVYFTHPDKVKEIDDGLENFQAGRQLIVDRLVQQIQKCKQPTALSLGSFWDEKAFPSEEEVLASCVMSWVWQTFSSPDETTGISAEMLARSHERTDKMLQRIKEQMSEQLRSEFSDLVSKLKAKLVPDDGTSAPRRFTHAPITNIRDFIETFKFRNFADDAELEASVEQMAMMLEGVSYEQLKGDSSLRDEINTKIAAMIASAKVIDDEWELTL